MFDGKTTKGWRAAGESEFPHSSWTVEDGALRTIGDPKTNALADLATEAEFADFELSLQWKVSERGNSGIKYLLQEAYFGELMGTRRGPKALGFEFQLTDDQRDPDALSSAKQKTGALYYLFSPSEDFVATADTWHSARLIVRNGKVEHWVDGRRVLRFSLDSPDLRRALDSAIASGPRPMTLAGLRAMRTRSHVTTPIALQYQGGGAWFRNIKLRPFSKGRFPRP